MTATYVWVLLTFMSYNSTTPLDGLTTHPSLDQCMYVATAIRNNSPFRAVCMKAKVLPGQDDQGK